MKMKPMGDFVLLKKLDGQETTKAGIILTSNTDNHVRAEAIACGPGLFTQTGDRIPMTVKPGNTVMITEQSSKQHNQINQGELFKEQSIAISKINKQLSKDVFNNFVPA